MKVETMTEALDDLIFEACFEAAIILDEDVKQMSCFLKNWGYYSPSTEEDVNLAA